MAHAERRYSGITGQDHALMHLGDNNTVNNYSISLTLNSAQEFAAQVRQSCPRSTVEFRALYTAIGSMYTALQETESELQSETLDRPQAEQLYNLGRQSRDVLTELEEYIRKYESWGTKAQRSWDRMGYRSEEMEELKARLERSTDSLVEFQDVVGRLEQKLEKLVREIQAGKREGSVVSTGTIHRLNEEDGWKLLCKELEDIGISSPILTAKRQFIVQWFKDAVASGALNATEFEDDEGLSVKGSLRSQALSDIRIDESNPEALLPLSNAGSISKVQDIVAENKERLQTSNTESDISTKQTGKSSSFRQRVSPSSKNVFNSNFSSFLDSATIKTIAKLEGHTSCVRAVAFSPDGKLIASASDDMTVKLWDPITRASPTSLKGHWHRVSAVAFSPDGKFIASGSHTRIKLWNSATGEAHAELDGCPDSVNAVAFSPDSKLIASIMLDSTVGLWDTATGASRGRIKGHSASARAVAFSPDGKLIASASADGTVRLWDTATMAAHARLEGHSGFVTKVAFSPNGKLIASAAEDKTVRLWNIATRTCHAKLEGHLEPIRAISFSPDSKLIASASADRTVRIWDSATGSWCTRLEGHWAAVTAVAFSPDSRLIASASSDDTVRLWDTATGEAYTILDGHLAAVWAVIFSPDGRFIASASLDKTVRLWAIVLEDHKEDTLDKTVRLRAAVAEERKENTVVKYFKKVFK